MGRNIEIKNFRQVIYPSKEVTAHEEIYQGQLKERTNIYYIIENIINYQNDRRNDLEKDNLSEGRGGKNLFLNGSEQCISWK